MAGVLYAQPRFRDLWVRGELSNLRRPSSGHLYFSLKDERSQLAAVMYRSDAVQLRWQPEHGQRILAHGRLDVYEAKGEVQLCADELQPDGVGSLHLAFEQLKARLQAEGLFEAALKRQVPEFPNALALVTSASGAAVRDMLVVLRRRSPHVALYLVPVAVQGVEAPAQIAAALGMVGRLPADAVVLARGGGSLEDLWAFNSEMVARAIRGCALPVICGVGHETDVTIADFAADVRAPTPSAAAELAAPSRQELLDRLRQRLRRGEVGLRRRLRADGDRLARTGARLERASPARLLAQRQQRLDERVATLQQSMRRRLAEAHRRADHAYAQLHALSPLLVLGRGFAVVRDAQGKVVRSVAELSVGEDMEALLSDGRLRARISAVEPGALLPPGARA
jgi:exodeoxyribonuclease VII large subunit